MMANQEEEQQQQQQQQVLMIKGKRTKRPRITINSSGDDTGRISTSSSTITTVTDEEEDMANCLILLAQGASKIQKLTDSQPDSSAVITVSAARTPPATAGMYVYECKTCNRSFSSFQALGGHRASHKKPKAESPATATALSLSDEHRKHQDRFESAENSKINKVEDLGLSLQIACNSSNTLSVSNNHNNDVISNNNNKSNKVHACAICGAEFSSGQALGGHMRRHRPINANSGSPPAQSASPPAPAPRNLLCLDLNLPADEQEEQQPESSKFMFATSEKTLVFAASLVDCRY